MATTDHTVTDGSDSDSVTGRDDPADRSAHAARMNTSDANSGDANPDDVDPNEVDPDDVDSGANAKPTRSVSIEILEPPEPDGTPRLDPATRVDTMVQDRLLPTARLEDGRYIAWWFDADAPDPYDEATTEWVVAPTRFLAAATFRELTEDPARFDELVGGDGA